MSSCFWFVTFLKITPRMSFPISKRLTFLDYFSYMQFSRYILAPLVCRSHSLRLASSCLGSVSQTPCGIFVTELFFMLLKIPDWCFISHQKTELFCSTLWSLVKPVIITALPCWYRLVRIFSTQTESHRNVPVSPGSEYLYLFYIDRTLPCSFLRDLAATCSPTPSPVQYHRPLRC